MRKNSFLTAILATFGAFTMILTTGCMKSESAGCEVVNCDFAASDSQVVRLESLLTSENIISDFTKDCSGAYYRIVAPGSAERISSGCSFIVANYVGTLTNGTQFDASRPGEPLAISLNQLISGWQALIPKLGKGGRMVMYLPPDLAYGRGATNSFGPYSILKFEIELLDFN